MDNLEERITRTKGKIEEIKKRWPFHSPKISMVRELEELEIELEELLEKKRSAQEEPGRSSTGTPGGG